MSIEFFLLIVKMDPLLYATPMHVEGNICRNRRAILQSVKKVVIVFDIYIVDFRRGRCVIEVDFYTLIVYLLHKMHRGLAGVASSRSTSTLSSGMRIVQNRPLGAIPGLKSCI